MRIRSQRDLDALPERSRAARERALKALASARREGEPVQAAAKKTNVSMSTVRKYVSGALRKDAFGRWRATAADRLLRVVRVMKPGGEIVSVETRGSRVSSRVGAYWDALRSYVNTGDRSALTRFRGQRAGGIEFETDPDVIDEQARRGELEFESIYQLTSWTEG